MFDEPMGLAPSNGRSSDPAPDPGMRHGIKLAAPEFAAAARPGPGLLTQLWRRRWSFALTFGLVLAVAIASLKILPTRYSASGSIIVAEQEPSIGNASAAWVQKLGDPADLESQLLLMRSPRVIRLAMAEPGVAEAAQSECDTIQKASSLSDWVGEKTRCADLLPGSAKLLDWVTSRYTVAAVGRSRVISVSYQSPTPEVARVITNALITVFLADQREGNAQSREDAAAWLWKEVAQLDTSLREGEADIQRFRRENGLVRGQLAPISSERLSSLSLQLSAAQGARAEAAARVLELGRGRVGALALDSGEPAQSRAALDNLAIANIKQQLATVVAQVASAAQTLGPFHPTLLALRQQEAGLRGQLRGEASSIGVGARRALQAANAQVASLTTEQEALKEAVTTATDKESAISDMVRAVEIKRGQYETLYKRASELETERRVLTGSTRLVSLAELPTLPFFPKRGPFLAAGLTLAAILGTLAALLRDRSDRRIRSTAPIETLTQTPVLAQIPAMSRVGAPWQVLTRLPSLRRGGSGLEVLLTAAKGAPLAQDALRMLHARLVLIGLGAASRKLLITSAQPQEGKTFTCLALAQLIAASGRRVLVIECDLRRPGFATALGLRDGPGLSDVLRAEVSVLDAVVETRTPNLFALPAGRPCENSTELLMGRNMTQVLHWSNEYEVVLLDSPPSEVMMDAQMLAPQVDGVICCARYGQTLTGEIASAVEGLRAAGGHVVGVVLTSVDPSEHRLYDWRPARRQVTMVHD